MTKLSDIQRTLLSSAASRSDGRLLPPPDAIPGQAAGLRKTVASLLKRDLVAETGVTDVDQVWKREGERQLGLVITDAGREAIGVEVVLPAETSTPATTEPVVKPITKGEKILTLLRRQQGATLVDLAKATNWLPHTTRAALTGLRKKGHAIARDKRDGVTTYSLPAA